MLYSQFDLEYNDTSIMRVIYKYEGANSYIPPAPTSGANRKESVIVISSERNPDARQAGLQGEAEGKAVSFSGEGYDVEISREALERNEEVRKHEKAHMAVLGSAAASGIMYDTRSGPGGENIAVGGKIAVDLSEVPGDPSATLSKARTIIAAAYAAASPSGGDMRTAADAYRLASKAQEELNLEKNRGNIDIFA